MCLVAQSCLTLCDLMDCSLPGSSVPGDSPGKNTGVGCHALLQDLPNPGDLPIPGIEPRSPALQADSLLSEPPGKPKNMGVGSLSLLQGNFLTQESNRGLLHRRQTVYQLRYQGSPYGLIQFSSVTQSIPTLCDPMNRSMPPPCPSPTPGVHSNSRPSSR